MNETGERSEFDTPAELRAEVKQRLGDVFAVTYTGVDDEDGLIAQIERQDGRTPPDTDINAVCLGYYSPDASMRQWTDAPFIVWVGESEVEIVHEHSAHDDMEAALNAVRDLYKREGGDD